MEFFRSAKLRRIMYVIAFGLALVRFASNTHRVDQPVHLAAPPPATSTTHHTS